MLHVVICGLSVWLSHHLPHYLINVMIFDKIKVIEHKTCDLIFSRTLSEKFLILRRIEQHIIIHVHTSLCKVPVVLMF